MRLALLFVAVGAVAVFAGAAPLQAAMVPSGSGTATPTESNYPGGSGGWQVYDSTNTSGYQDVYYDPNAGPWQKNLGAIPGGGAINGAKYMLTEMLHVSGGPTGTAPAWADFHEVIGTPGWTWTPSGTQGNWGFGSPTYGGNWTYVISAGNTAVNWGFNPDMPVCTQFTLTKWLVFNAQAPGANPNAPLIVFESVSVPEPATLGMLAVGGLGILLRRRRKK